MNTHVVAVRAADLLRDDLESDAFEARDFSAEEGRLAISSPDGSNLVRIEFTADDAGTAIAGANALLQAYEEGKQEEAGRLSASALAQLNERVAEIDDELEAISAAIESDIPSEVQESLSEQSRALLDRIVEIQAELLATNSQDSINELGEELQVLSQAVATSGSLTETLGPRNLQGLIDRQSGLMARRAELVSTLDAIEVNAELTATGITFVSPAIEATEIGGAGFTTLALGILLGIASSVGTAHWLATREPKVDNRKTPATILRAEFLGDLPSFSKKRLKSEVPVRDARFGTIAEAFRFAATSLDSVRGVSGSKIICMVSPTVGDGKSTICANLALSLASTMGKSSRILLVDGDFGGQGLTSIFASGDEVAGLTDLNEASKHTIDRVAQKVDVGNGSSSVYLLTRGHGKVSPPAFFSSDETKSLFRELRQQFDLVIVDTPPMVHVAYAASLAKLADSAVVVIRHRTKIRHIEDVRRHLQLVGTLCIGYLYTRSPRIERTLRKGGSLAGVVDDT